MLDEPGVYLHVNAQKELLNLFNDLTTEKNQIVYTTHSPYMINNKDLLNVRAIDKDDKGITRIHKNIYSQNLSSDSKMETISPLVKAIGADFRFNIGPSSIFNIVTEGISDYIYMQTFIKYFNIANPPSVIPLAGVTNANKVISILIGWGADFKILFDYDKAGFDEHKKIIKDLDETLENRIVYVNCKVKPEKVIERSEHETIESLIHDDDFKKLSNPFIVEDKNTKIIAAREFHDKVVSGDIIPTEYTVEKFKILFDRLMIL